MPGLLPAWAANAALVAVLVFLAVAYLMNRDSRFFTRAVQSAEFLPAVFVAAGAAIIIAADDVAAMLGVGDVKLVTLLGASVVVGAVIVWAMD